MYGTHVTHNNASCQGLKSAMSTRIDNIDLASRRFRYGFRVSLFLVSYAPWFFAHRPLKYYVWDLCIFILYFLFVEKHCSPLFTHHSPGWTAMRPASLLTNASSLSGAVRRLKQTRNIYTFWAAVTFLNHSERFFFLVCIRQINCVQLQTVLFSIMLLCERVLSQGISRRIVLCVEESVGNFSCKLLFYLAGICI